MENKLYEYFLSRYKYDEKDSRDYNYRFNQKYSIEKFNSEFNKFIHMLDNFFYDNNKIVTSIDSYDILLLDKVLRHISKLYIFTLNHNLTVQKNIIEDFLLTYYKTLEINKSGSTKNKKAIEKYKRIMKEFNIKYFYKQFVSDCSDFYLKATDYGIKNDLYFAPEVIYKMMNNILEDSYKEKIIKELLKNDKYFFITIKYDNKLKNNKKYYLKFITEILNQDYGEDSINDILALLISKNTLTEKELKDIINLYILKTNKICYKYLNKNGNFTFFLSEIESLRKCLIEVLNINKIKKEYKQKIHECIINLLSLKRYLLSDETYINSNMHEFSTTTEISNKKINQFVSELLENKYKLYTASSIDFDKCLEDSIKHYSKFALQSILSSFTINSKTQTYYTNSQFSSNYKYSFEKYYEEIGENYTKKNKSKLLNVLSKGYYIEMLRDLSKTFYLHQNISLNFLGDDNFRKIINELRKDTNYPESNDYQMIVGNILAIEVNINKIMSKNNIKYTKDPIKNLDLLFAKYQNNKIARNGIMYLYYSLYEKSGPNLRNKAMHGTLINEDLSIPLLISFSGLIFSNWLLGGQ